MAYGSAEVGGTLWSDYVCLEPLEANNLNDPDDIVDFLDNTETCTQLDFLALRYAVGLEPWVDGILGLSPNFEPEFDDGHILARLRD